MLPDSQQSGISYDCDLDEGISHNENRMAGPLTSATPDYGCSLFDGDIPLEGFSVVGVFPQGLTLNMFAYLL